MHKYFYEKTPNLKIPKTCLILVPKVHHGISVNAKKLKNWEKSQTFDGLSGKKILAGC